MPLYDYRCADCGDFREFRSMAQSDVPHACPGCGKPSDRLFTTPFLAAKTAPTAPSSRPFSRGAAFGHVCGHGCAHSAS